MKHYVIAHTNLFENSTEIVFVHDKSEASALSNYLVRNDWEASAVNGLTLDELKEFTFNADQIIEVAEVPDRNWRNYVTNPIK